jgi:hypothetical protein
MNSRRTTISTGIAMMAILTLATGSAAAPAPRVPDFDGDGYADLPVGAPRTNVAGRRDAGAVHVFYGTKAGLRDGKRQAWSKAHAGVIGQPAAQEHFGNATAVGDFDGDGYADLAIGSKYEKIGARRGAGAVHVLYGAPAGLSGKRSQRWHQGSPGIAEKPEKGDQFGRTLAVHDFDGDGRDDLVVGVQQEDRGGKDAGVVHVIYGSASGLTAKGSQLWHQDRAGIADRTEIGDFFGRALTAGDFDRDGFGDLAIGAPYEDRRADRAGVVHVIYGSRKGLSAKGSQLWHQDAPGIADRAEERDQFGQSLAAADIDRDGADDLIVGVWFEDYLNDLSNEGAFHVIYGSGKGLRAKGNEFWHQDRSGIKDRRDISDRFGQAFAAADFDGDGFDDVAVGTPSTDLRPGVHGNHGAVHVFRGSRGGITAKGDQYIHQGKSVVIGKPERFAHFGSALAAADYDGDGFADLAVGIPWDDRATRDAGSVYVVHGSRRGLRFDRDYMLVSQGSGLSFRQRRSSMFGWSLSGEKPASGTSRVVDPKV